MIVNQSNRTRNQQGDRTSSAGTWWTRSAPAALAALVIVVGSAVAATAAQPQSRLVGRGMAKKTGTNQKGTPDIDPNIPRPIIDAGDGIHDFGTVWVGPVLKHTFSIKNTGTDVLKITKVKPSCGCTLAGTHPKEIKPGDTGQFPFSVSSTKLRGRFEKAVTITSNDPSTPSLRLRLRGEVKRYIDVAPASVQFGKLYGADPKERVLKLTNNTESPLALEISKQPGGNFTAELVERVPGQKFEIKVTANPPFDSGIFRKYVEISTNVEEQKTIKIDMRGSVPERLEVNPKVLTIGRPGSAGKTDTKLTRVIRFTNYGGAPTRILGATVDDSKIDVSVKEQREGQSYSIQVQIPAGYELPKIGRKITLKTDDPKKPSLVVPIRGFGNRTVKSNIPTKPRRPAQALEGNPAPLFSLTTLEGKPVNNRDKNNITVLDFFAVNCGFCSKQLPRLESVRAAFEGKPVRFVAVSQTMRGKRYTEGQVRDKLKTAGFRGEVVTDPDNTAGTLFKSTSFPTMVVLGKTGKVEAVNIGNLGDLEKRLTTQLTALVAGKAIPKIDTVAVKPTKNAPKRIRANDLIGKPAPAFSTVTFAGKKVSSTDFAKHPATILNFVAGNCGYCGKQIPRLEKIRQSYEGKGVRFVNVVETMRTPFTKQQVVDKMTKLGSKLEIAHDVKNAIGPGYGASGFPTMVVVGKSGKVEAVNVGNIADLETRVKGQLDALIAGKALPKVAAAAKKPPARKQPGSSVGSLAPAFAPADTFAGKKLSTADFAKHPATVLNFVAGNCGYCGKQIPRLEKIRQAYEGKGVRFVNVVETMRTPFTKTQVVDKMTKLGSKLEVVHDVKNAIGPKYGARGFPTMVVVGKSGKIEAVNVGNIGDLETRVKGQLDALIAGKPLPKVAAAKKPPARKQAAGMVGSPAPAFATASTFAGKKLATADFAKHPATVLNFVAGNCGYCGKQIPRLEKIRQSFESKGVRFVNVVETMRTPFTKTQVVDKMTKLGSKLEVVHDVKNAIGPKYGANGFPTMVVVGKSGKVEAVNVGNIADLETRVTAQLTALVAGKPIPASAMTKRATPSRTRPAEGLVGKQAPNFALTTLEGKSFTNATLAAHPATVLNFFAPNCGYCKRAMPNVEKVRKEYEAKGVRFINVAQKMRKVYSDEEITDVLKKVGAQLELATSDFATNSLGRVFKATSFPTMFVLGRDGKVAAVNVGAKANLEQLLKGQLDKLLK